MFVLRSGVTCWRRLRDWSRADIHRGLLDLACALICCGYLRNGF